MVKATGTDKKEYEMVALPFKFVFGWLFTIQINLVKESAKEALIKYQMECYDALYEYFVGAKKFLEVKELATEEATQKLKAANKNFYEAKKEKREAENSLFDIAHLTYQEYLENNSQLSFEFVPEAIEEGGQS